MFDTIRNVGDFLSPHWLSEAFPGKLGALTKEWRERTEHGKHSPLKGLAGTAGAFVKAKAELPDPGEDGYRSAVTELHRLLLDAMGIEVAPTWRPTRSRLRSSCRCSPGARGRWARLYTCCRRAR